MTNFHDCCNSPSSPSCFEWSLCVWSFEEKTELGIACFHNLDVFSSDCLRLDLIDFSPIFSVEEFKFVCFNFTFFLVDA